MTSSSYTAFSVMRHAVKSRDVDVVEDFWAGVLSVLSSGINILKPWLQVTYPSWRQRVLIRFAL